MGSTPQPPPPPDPNATAKAQQGFSSQAALQQYGLNAANQVTPFGTLSYAPTGVGPGGIPTYTATQTFSPEGQAALARKGQLGDITGSSALNIARLLSDRWSTPFDLSGLPAAPTAELGPIRAKVSAPIDLATTEARLTELGRRRLDPLVAQRTAALETQLINQGVQPGTEAWTRAKMEQAQQSNDLYNQLFLTGNQQAYGQAADEATRRFGQETALDAAEAARQAQLFGQQAGLRGTALQERLFERSQPFGELSQLIDLGGFQPTAPSYVGTPQVQIAPVDYGQLAQNQYLGQQNAYNQQMAQKNALYGALGSLGGTALGGWASGGFAKPKFG